MVNGVEVEDSVLTGRRILGTFLLTAVGGALLVLLVAALWIIADPIVDEKVIREEASTEKIYPIRGKILDARGVPLAMSVSYLSAEIIPSEVIKGIEKYNDGLAKERVKAKEMGLSTSNISEDLTLEQWANNVANFISTYTSTGFSAPTANQIYDQVRNNFTSKESVSLFRRIKTDASEAIRDKSIVVPGLSLIERAERLYPDKMVARQVIGIVQRDNQAGVEGVEKMADKYLAGIPGSQPSRRGTWEISDDRVIPPVNGLDVRITIDQRIQNATEKVLGNAVKHFNAIHGSAVVLEVGTGDIKAMATLPTVEPDDRTDQELRRNRVVVDAYEHGSVDKIVTLAGVIEENIGNPSSTLLVPPSIKVGIETFHDAEWHEPESWTMKEILARSSNVGIIKFAQSLGEERFYNYLKKFGFGDKTSVDFLGESPGILRPLSEWNEASLPTMAFGQGISSTLMQTAQAYSIIADGGYKVPPTLVDSTIDSKGEETPLERPQTEQVISERTAKLVTEMLVAAVEEDYGTARNGHIPGYSVAGKTGTAQKVRQDKAGYVEGQYISSYAGFAPADDPKYVVAVHLDNPTPYNGSLSAAPTFAAIMAQTLSLTNVPPSYSTDEPLPDGDFDKLSAKSDEASVETEEE